MTTQGPVTDRVPWTSVAASAVSAALGTGGRAPGAVTLRDAHETPRLRWASFDHTPSGDVVWAAQIDGSAPAGSQAVDTDLGDVGVWRYPNDPALPGLRDAVTEGGLAAVISALATDVDAGTVQVVSLQPLQHAVVRIGRPGRAVYVKVVPPWRVEDVATRHRRGSDAGLPVPRVLHTDGSQGIVVLSELPGTPLAEHLENGNALPRVDDVWSLIERITESMGTHGDLHDRQLLIGADGTVVGIVDLDDAGQGDLLDDLARLVAHVEVRGETHPDQRQRVRGFAAELVSTFEQHVDGDELRRRTRTHARRLDGRRIADRAGAEI